MWYWVWVVAFLIIVSSVSAQNDSKWFEATFDGDLNLSIVTLNGPCGDPKGSEACWRWRLQGLDSSGFMWPDDLSDGPWGCDISGGRGLGITLVGADKVPYTDYFDVQLVDVGGDHGTVLYQEHVRVDMDTRNGTGWKSRLENACNLRQPVYEMGYIGFDVYLQDDLESQHCYNGEWCWRMLTEANELGGSGVMRLTMERSIWRNNEWEWVLKLDEHQEGGTVNVWKIILPTPLPEGGKWTHVEWEWVRHETAGTAKLWLDGVLVINKTGQTMVDNTLGVMDWLTLYTDSRYDVNQNPSSSWQYLDNVVICESRDCMTQSCHWSDLDCDGSVGISELVVVIQGWMSGSRTISELVEVIQLWKNG